MPEPTIEQESIISRRSIIEGVVGLGMLILAFIAIASSDVSGDRTHRFWTALVIFYALVAYTVDRLYSGISFKDARRAFTIVLHWFGIFAAMLLIYFFAKAGRVANADIGLTYGLILALGTFLSGVHSNWRLMVVGGALGLGTAGVAFIEAYLWVLFGIAALSLLVFVIGSKFAKSIKLPTDD